MKSICRLYRPLNLISSKRIQHHNKNLISIYSTDRYTPIASKRFYSIPPEKNDENNNKIENDNTKRNDGIPSHSTHTNFQLSKDDESILNQISKAQSEHKLIRQEDWEHFENYIRRHGFPEDLRPLLKRLQSDDIGLFETISLLPKLITQFNQLASKVVKEDTPLKNGSDLKKPFDYLQKDNAEKFRKNDHDSSQNFNQKPNQNNKDSKDSKDQPSQPWKFVMKMDLGTLIISTIVLAYLTNSMLPGENSKEITWQELRSTFLEKGLVEKIVVINHSKAKVYLQRENVATMYPESPAVNRNFFYFFTIGSVEAFERRLDQAQEELGIPSHDRIPVAYQAEEAWGSALFLGFAPTLLFLGGLFFLSRRAGSSVGGGQGGIFGMMRSRAKQFNHETDVKIKFSDVAGMDEAKQEIMEFVSFLKEPAIYQKLGAKIPRGAILSGPPGTGKTLLAKATAGESGVPFFSVSGSEFVEMFVGVGASRVRDLFSTARKNSPCIIFIDEIDAVGRARGSGKFSGGNDERESTLNQILTEMDGFNTSEQVVVMAGTNRVDILDKALLRPGRFDRNIVIDKPTMDGRKHIFAVHLNKIVTKEDIELLKGRLSALTPGFSGADIANCVNEAALIAARNKQDSVKLTHFEQAIERVIGGLERKSLILSPEEKKTVAYHEAGHAICGWYFKWADPLLKVSIIPRGSGALGYAQYVPKDGDSYLMNAQQLMDRMAMTLGGRISEELHFETVTSGAADDFKKVTRMATAMVTRFGMSEKIGPISFDDDGEQQFQKPFSEETGKAIDNEVRRIIDTAYKQCKDLLQEKKKEVGLVAEELLRKEVLTRDDMVRLLGNRPFDDKGEFYKYFDGKHSDLPPSSGVIGNDTPPSGETNPSPTIYHQEKVL